MPWSFVFSYFVLVGVFHGFPLLSWAGVNVTLNINLISQSTVEWHFYIHRLKYQRLPHITLTAATLARRSSSDYFHPSPFPMMWLFLIFEFIKMCHVGSAINFSLVFIRTTSVARSRLWIQIACCKSHPFCLCHISYNLRTNMRNQGLRMTYIVARLIAGGVFSGTSWGCSYAVCKQATRRCSPKR